MEPATFTKGTDDDIPDIYKKVTRGIIKKEKTVREKNLLVSVVISDCKKVHFVSLAMIEESARTPRTSGKNDLVQAMITDKFSILSLFILTKHLETQRMGYIFGRFSD